MIKYRDTYNNYLTATLESYWSRSRTLWQIASVNSEHFEFPPRSFVRTLKLDDKSNIKSEWEHINRSTCLNVLKRRLPSSLEWCQSRQFRSSSRGHADPCAAASWLHWAARRWGWPCLFPQYLVQFHEPDRGNELQSIIMKHFSKNIIFLKWF